MTLYALNPAIIYESAYWGQVDALNTFFMLASVLFLMRQRIALSWLMLTIAFLFKMHAIILVPVMFFVSLRRYHWKRLLKAGILSLVVFLILLLPFIYHGQAEKVIHAYTYAVDAYPYISVNALNLWWLIQPIDVQNQVLTFLEGKHDNHPAFAGITYKQFGLFFLGLFTLFILFVLYKNTEPNTIALAAFAMSFAYFILPTQIHERYMFPALALLSVIYHSSRYLRIMYVILTITFFINLQQGAGFSDPRSLLLTKIVTFPATMPLFTTITAFINVVVFGYLICYLINHFGKKKVLEIS